MLTPITPAEFDLIYQLMEEAFPPDERRNYAGQRALLDDPVYQILVRRGDGPRQPAICGFFALYRLDTVIFVEHFAVHPLCRGQGLGGQMMAELVASAPLPICLEVEPPDTPIARRRIDFYRRTGLHLCTLPYIQPALGEDRSPIPLLLMTSGAPLSPDGFATMRETIYRQVYHCKAEQTPTLL